MGSIDPGQERETFTSTKRFVIIMPPCCAAIRMGHEETKVWTVGGNDQLDSRRDEVFTMFTLKRIDTEN